MCERCVYPRGNNQEDRSAGGLNNGPAPHNWTVLWEPSSEAHGKWGGRWELFHCSSWMMGMRVMLAVLFCFFVVFIFKEVQFNILSGQAGDGVPSAAGTIVLSACWKAPPLPLIKQPHTHIHRIQEYRYWSISSLYKGKKPQHKHNKSIWGYILTGFF